MSRRRIVVLAVLWLLPFAVMMSIGSYAMWVWGWWWYLWWPMAACVALAYLLGWYWARQKQLLPSGAEPAGHWTDRDREAWKLVEARAAKIKDTPLEQLENLHSYLDAGKSLAEELARFYHPHSKDPLGQVTIPELLTVAELAAHDMHELTETYIPGGHLLTVNHWRQARRASDWYQTANHAWWLVAALFNPVKTGMRFAASKFGVSQPWQQLQQSIADWFYAAYVHRIGAYLIELYSGRLGVGAARYRELQAADESSAMSKLVTIAILGKVKAGKSSVINALLGEQQARTDVLPETDTVTRYRLKQDETELDLLDTVGYGHEGPRADQMKATERAARESDVLLLVMHARDPGREADVRFLKRLRSWFAEKPELKMPPTIAVQTHVDLLSPAMEWSPPYDWRTPTGPKEESMAAAVAAAQEQFGDLARIIVPVCAAPGKVFNVVDELMPAILSQMDEAHAVAFLRCLKADVDQDRLRKVLRQIVSAGREAAVIALKEWLKK